MQTCCTIGHNVECSITISCLMQSLTVAVYTAMATDECDLVVSPAEMKPTRYGFIMSQDNRAELTMIETINHAHISLFDQRPDC